MMVKEELAGILLAGGASRRFGSPKAFANVEGKPFYKHSLETLQAITGTIFIITNEQLEVKFENIADAQIMTDDKKYRGKGPLAGLYTAMQAIKAEWYALIPVDVPFINPEIYHTLLEQRAPDLEAVIPLSNGRLQPLIALYHHSLAGRLKELLDTDQLAMRALLDISKVKYVPFTDPAAFININWQEDYNRHIRNRG